MTILIEGVKKGHQGHHPPFCNGKRACQLRKPFSQPGKQGELFFQGTFRISAGAGSICAERKVFPHCQEWEYLAALRQPFPEVRFVPTGGVGPKNAAAFFLAGAAALGMGSSIFPQRRIEAEGTRAVAELTEVALRAAAPGE